MAYGWRRLRVYRTGAGEYVQYRGRRWRITWTVARALAPPAGACILVRPLAADRLALQLPPDGRLAAGTAVPLPLAEAVGPGAWARAVSEELTDD